MNFQFNLECIILLQSQFNVYVRMPEDKINVFRVLSMYNFESTF